jgi:hypothetical protein
MPGQPGLKQGNLRLLLGDDAQRERAQLGIVTVNKQLPSHVHGALMVRDHRCREDLVSGAPFARQGGLHVPMHRDHALHGCADELGTLQGIEPSGWDRVDSVR